MLSSIAECSMISTGEQIILTSKLRHSFSHHSTEKIFAFANFNMPGKKHEKNHMQKNLKKSDILKTNNHDDDCSSSQAIWCVIVSFVRESEKKATFNCAKSLLF